MVDDAGQRRDGLGGSARVLDRLLEVEVDDVVAVVGDVGALPVRPRPQPGLAAPHLGELGQPLEVELPAELDNLHGHRVLGPAQAGDQLRLVDDADKPVRDQLDHLLAQQRAAAALDEVELRVDLVGAVDGEVEARDGVERGEGDVEACGVVVRGGKVLGFEGEGEGEGAGEEKIESGELATSLRLDLRPSFFSFPPPSSSLLFSSLILFLSFLLQHSLFAWL